MLKWLFSRKKVSPQLPQNFREKLDADAVEIVERLQRSGFETYLVGGCVRDILLNQNPKDFDIATSASPQKVKSLIHRAFIIGKRFRIVLAKRNVRESQAKTSLFPIFRKDLPEKEIQITTFRREPTEIDGQINENVFGTAKEDAFRRDFSLNALFLDPVRGTIVDHVGGLTDLSKGKLVIIGNPAVRFKEDPIRIFRAIRFMARAGLTLEKSTEQGLLTHLPELKNAKKERVREEFLKILREGHTAKVFTHLKKIQAWKFISPSLETYFSNSKIWEQTLVLAQSLRSQKWEHPSQSPLIFTIFYPIIELLFDHRSQRKPEAQIGQRIFEDLKVSKAEWDDLLKIRWNLSKILKDPEARQATRFFSQNSGGKNISRNYIWTAQSFWVLHVLSEALPKEFSKVWKNWSPFWKTYIENQAREHKNQWYSQKRNPRRRNNSRRGGPRNSQTGSNSALAVSTSVRPAPASETPAPSGESFGSGRRRSGDSH
jgi:poly(A) polymerase